MANDFEPAERGLRDHLALWRRRAAIILGITALAVVAMLALSLTQTKSYQASAQVIFPVEPAGQPGQDPGQVRFDPNRVIQTEAIFAAGDQVRAKVDEKVGTGGTITARGLKDSDVVVITATASDPQRAALLANTAAAAYVELRQPPAGGSGVTGVAGVQIVDPAEAPSAAANGSIARNLAFALAIGLVLGLVAAYAVDHLDDAVRDDDALERATGLPVLGGVTDPGTPSSPTGSAASIRPVALDDPVLATAERAALLGALDEAPNAGATRVLVVPIKARGRDVRDAIEMLQGVGIEVVACALLTPRRAAVDAPPPADAPPPGARPMRTPADATAPRPDSLSPSLAADAEPSAQPAGRRPRA
jgi:capsular polysaccharide biosynthesis protein